METVESLLLISQLLEVFSNNESANSIFMFCLQANIDFSLLNHLTSQRNNHTRIAQFYEKWIDLYLDSDYFSHFRMSRKTFQTLFAEVAIILSKNVAKSELGGHPPVVQEKSLLFTLWYLSKGDTLISTADRFNVAISTAHEYIEINLRALCKLANKFIQWPKEHEYETISTEFSEKGYPDVIGAIDGCHIMCTVPSEQHDSYANRKLQHSIILQGVCTASKIFTNICVGFPGSVHDARVLRECKLYHLIETHGVETYFGHKFHLLGDSAYPCLKWLITPYRDTGRLINIHKHHNKVHSATRVAIEHVYGLLKQRWRILKFVNVYSIKKVVQITTACCMLHNYCLINKDYFDYETENEDMEMDDDCEMHVINNRQDGVRKRDEIANSLM